MGKILLRANAYPPPPLPPPPTLIGERSLSLTSCKSLGRQGQVELDMDFASLLKG